MNSRLLAAPLFVSMLALLAGCGGGTYQRAKIVESRDIDRFGLAEAKAGPAFGQTDRNLDLFAVLYGPPPTGIAVSRDERVFVCYPRWGERVDISVAEVTDEAGVKSNLVPIPNSQWQLYDPSTPDRIDPATHLVSVQSITIDEENRLWILDTGSINFGKPVAGGPKLLCYDLADERIVNVIPLSGDVVLPTTYVNDVRIDLQHGEAGFAYISDSGSEGPNGIIVVDIHGNNGEATMWRKLTGEDSVRAAPNFRHSVEGQVLQNQGRRDSGRASLSIGIDGIALSPDAETLYFCALAGETLYKVSTDYLRTPPSEEGSARENGTPDVAEMFAQPVQIVGGMRGKRFPSDGLHADDDGRVYITDVESNAIRVYDPRLTQPGETLPLELVLFDKRLLWPDSIDLAEGHLYVTSNQLHRSKRFRGKDQRDPPYPIFRTTVQSSRRGIRGR